VVDFLWWEGCPSHQRALAELREALGEVGLDPAAIRMRRIDTEDQAARAGFTGSPTILVDGRDVAGAADEPVLLACRVYRRRDGRPSPVPDPDDLRDALRAALSGAPR
jgi:hypothetical protein